MFLASTLLDTLCSHFTVSFPEPEQVTLTVSDAAPFILSLQQHLPTARQFDLTGVPLQIGCTLDHVAALLHPCAYQLWKSLPSHLRPVGTEFAGVQCEWPDATPIDAITVFTDGSFDGNCSSWAFHAQGSSGQHSRNLGWIGGLVSLDPADPNFVGATTHGALQGELTALFWCLTWLLRTPSSVRITVFSDCTSAIGLSDGRFGSHNGQGFMQALGAAIPMQRFSIQHVKSHVGHAGNELADGLAKHCNSPAFDRAFWPVNPMQPFLRHGWLPWLWLYLEAHHKPEAWPTQLGAAFVDKPGPLPQLPTQAECEQMRLAYNRRMGQTTPARTRPCLPCS